MRRIIIAIALLSSFLGSTETFAAEPSFDEVKVSLWPEYDRLEMLVIYRIALPAEIGFPADVTVTIPGYIDEINAVAESEFNGPLLLASYTTESKGDGIIVHVTATLPYLQIEYYDSTLRFEGDQREFTYTWNGDIAVDSFTLEVLQPGTSYDFTVTPDLGSPTLNQDGLTFFSKKLGDLNQGQSLITQIKYKKANDLLEVANLQVEPASPLPERSSGLKATPDLLPWIIAGLGLIMLVGGALWYWRSGLANYPKADRANRTKRGRGISSSNVSQGVDATHCSECGHRLNVRDRFCRNCGSSQKNI